MGESIGLRQQDFYLEKDLFQELSEEEVVHRKCCAQIEQ